MLLTTHYMEEAARLCDRVAIIDHGTDPGGGRPGGAGRFARRRARHRGRDRSARSRTAALARPARRRGGPTRRHDGPPHGARGPPRGAAAPRPARRRPASKRAASPPTTRPSRTSSSPSPDGPWKAARPRRVRDERRERRMSTWRARGPLSRRWSSSPWRDCASSCASPRRSSGSFSSRSCWRSPSVSPSATARPIRCRWGSRRVRSPRRGSRRSAAARRSRRRSSPRPEARARARHRRLALVVLGTEPPTYWFDPDPARQPHGPARGRSGARARRRPGRRLRRRRSLEMTERGARYIDFLVPGPPGHEPHGHRHVGDRLLARRSSAPASSSSSSSPRRCGAGSCSPRRSWRASSSWRSRWRFCSASRSSCSTSRCAARLAAVAVVCVLGALSFVGLGLLVAARPRTIEGVSGLMNFVMFPMWIFSGVFFSNERFPAALQPFIQALPLTALNDAPARRHARGRVARLAGARARDSRRLGPDRLRRRAQALPLELTAAPRIRDAVSRTRCAPRATAS